VREAAPLGGEGGETYWGQGLPRVLLGFILNQLLRLIYISPMANAKNENDYPFFHDFCYESIVSNAISPLSTPIRRKPLPMLKWIGASFKIFAYPCGYKNRCVLVQFF
jgi:hypothetical protein